MFYISTGTLCPNSKVWKLWLHLCKSCFAIIIGLKTASEFKQSLRSDTSVINSIFAWSSVDMICQPLRRYNNDRPWHVKDVTKIYLYFAWNSKILICLLFQSSFSHLPRWDGMWEFKDESKTVENSGCQTKLDMDTVQWGLLTWNASYSFFFF